MYPDMERIFDFDAFDEEAALAALSEDFQRQLRSWSHMRNAARLYLIGQAIGGFSIRNLHETGQPTLEITDTLTWEQLDLLRSLVWRTGGVDYVVSSLEGRGEEVNDYGGTSIESYIEIHFTKKDA